VLTKERAEPLITGRRRKRRDGWTSRWAVTYPRRPPLEPNNEGFYCPPYPRFLPAPSRRFRQTDLTLTLTLIPPLRLIPRYDSLRRATTSSRRKREPHSPTTGEDPYHPPSGEC
jgi:hypothetical protein